MSQSLQAAAAALIPKLTEQVEYMNGKLDAILEILTAPPATGKPATFTKPAKKTGK